MALSCSSLIGQESIAIRGSILNEDSDITGLSVINTTLNKATITDAQGLFVITASLGDTLSIQGIPFQPLEIEVTQRIFTEATLQITLIRQVNDLDTVYVSNTLLSGNITKDGIATSIDPLKINRNPDAHNPISSEERRLHTATTRPHDLVGRNNLRFDFSLDNSINTLSGKKRRLKRNIETATLLKKRKEIRDSYSDHLYVNHLGIPVERIDDFLFWILDTQETREHLRSVNKLRALDYFITKKDTYLSMVDRQSTTVKKGAE